MFIAGSMINVVIVILTWRAGSLGIDEVCTKLLPVIGIVYVACFVAGMFMYGLLSMTRKPNP
jgi:hypothetical protein